jgi:hypothetical protein
MGIKFLLESVNGRDYYLGVDRRIILKRILGNMFWI